MSKKDIKQKSPIIGPAEAESSGGEPAFNLTNAASASECTGLIQVPPECEDELENYNDVYSFTRDRAQKKNRG